MNEFYNDDRNIFKKFLASVSSKADRASPSSSSSSSSSLGILLEMNEEISSTYPVYKKLRFSEMEDGVKLLRDIYTGLELPQELATLPPSLPNDHSSFTLTIEELIAFRGGQMYANYKESFYVEPLALETAGPSGGESTILIQYPADFCLFLRRRDAFAIRKRFRREGFTFSDSEKTFVSEKHVAEKETLSFISSTFSFNICEVRRGNSTTTTLHSSKGAKRPPLVLLFRLEKDRVSAKLMQTSAVFVPKSDAARTTQGLKKATPEAATETWSLHDTCLPFPTLCEFDVMRDQQNKAVISQAHLFAKKFRGAAAQLKEKIQTDVFNVLSADQKKRLAAQRSLLSRSETAVPQSEREYKYALYVSLLLSLLCIPLDLFPSVRQMHEFSDKLSTVRDRFFSRCRNLFSSVACKELQRYDQRCEFFLKLARMFPFVLAKAGDRRDSESASEKFETSETERKKFSLNDTEHVPNERVLARVGIELPEKDDKNLLLKISFLSGVAKETGSTYVLNDRVKRCALYRREMIRACWNSRRFYLSPDLEKRKEAAENSFSQIYNLFGSDSDSGDSDDAD